MNVLILGIGNILLSDEGVGVRIVEALAERYAFPDHVELLDGGTSGMDLLNAIAGRDLLLVCDAVKTDAAPGSVVRVDGDDVPAFFQLKLSPHQTGLCDVLATLELIDQSPADITLVGVAPADFDLGMTLSAEGCRGLEEAIEAVLDRLGTAGIRPRLRATPRPHHPHTACTAA